MKRVVVMDDLREFEIRPRSEFEEYSALVAEEVARLQATAEWVEVRVCAACRAPAPRPAFMRLGLSYVRCPACRSLYVSPRPAAAALADFQASSQAATFWTRRLAADTAEARTRYVFTPRVQWVMDTVADHGSAAEVVVDLHSKYPEVLQALRANGAFQHYFSYRPMPDAADACAVHGFGTLEEVPAGLASVVTAMEVLERAFDAEALARTAATCLQPGGLLFLTSLTASGFDIQVLGEHTPNLIPLTHLNVLTVEGIRGLLERAGFEILELSTPGRLDLEVVRMVAEREPSISLPAWVDDLVRRRDEPIHRAFQEFLQAAQLSSHLRLVARKKEEG